MLYTREQKELLQKIIQVFGGYLKQSPYLDLVWSDKVGYVLLKISMDYRNIEGESLVIEDGETLCEELFSEIVMDVLLETGNDHESRAVDALEGAEIARRFSPFLKDLPEYGEIANRCYRVKGK